MPGICGEALFVLLPKLSRAYVENLVSATRLYLFYCRNYLGLTLKAWYQRLGFICFTAEIISGLRGSPGICSEVQFVVLPKLYRPYVECLASAVRLYLFYCRNYLGLTLKTWYQRLGFICSTAEIISGLRGRPGICSEVQFVMLPKLLTATNFLARADL